MGHRHSPEEVGRAGRVCACDGGFVAADGESVAVCGKTQEYVIPKPVRFLNGVRNLFFSWFSCEQQIPHPQTTRVRDDKSDFFRSLLENLGVEARRHRGSMAASSPVASAPSTLTVNPSFLRASPSSLRASKSFGATGKRAALFALRFYKAYLSILFAGSCRFQPTCSQYSYEAIERFGVARGAWLTLKRLARCQPLSRKFGYDPVPEAWDKSEALAQDVRHSAATSHEVPT